MLQPIDQLANIADNATPEFERALRSLVRAIVNRDNAAHQRARESITRAIGQTHALAELLGRRRAILAAGLGDMPDGSIQFSAVVPAIEFEEAIANIIERTPVLAVSGEAVKEAFRRDPNVIAFARAADLAATRRVQRLLATFGIAGTPLPKAERVLQELEGWTRAYSETVFRTNLNSAFTEGVFAMARDDDVRDVVPALMFVDSRDPDVRKNHRAAHGMIASVGDPVWDTLKPPLGFNCRCSVRLIDKFEVREKFGASRVPKATIPPGAFPDPGFRS